MMEVCLAYAVQSATKTIRTFIWYLCIANLWEWKLLSWHNWHWLSRAEESPVMNKISTSSRWNLPVRTPLASSRRLCGLEGAQGCNSCWQPDLFMWKSLPCEDSLCSLTTVRLTVSWRIAEALHRERPGEALVKAKPELKWRLAQRLVMDHGAPGGCDGGLWNHEGRSLGSTLSSGVPPNVGHENFRRSCTGSSVKWASWGTGATGQVSFYYRGELLAGGADGGRREGDESHGILCGEDCLPYSTSFNRALKWPLGLRETPKSRLHLR